MGNDLVTLLYTLETSHMYCMAMTVYATYECYMQALNTYMAELMWNCKTFSALAMEMLILYQAIDRMEMLQSVLRQTIDISH